MSGWSWSDGRAYYPAACSGAVRHHPGATLGHGAGERPLCEAIRAECSRQFPDGSIDATMAFDELHDVTGRLTGLRMVRSTGCKPLDEATLIGRKEFRQRFEADGAPTLDDITVELRPGVDAAAVRIVRRVDNMQIGMGC